MKCEKKRQIISIKYSDLKKGAPAHAGTPFWIFDEFLTGEKKLSDIIGSFDGISVTLAINERKSKKKSHI